MLIREYVQASEENCGECDVVLKILSPEVRIVYRTAYAHYLTTSAAALEKWAWSRRLLL